MHLSDKKKPIQVFDRFKEFPLGSIGISSISLAELHYGVQKSSRQDRNKKVLAEFLLPLEIVDFDTSAALEYGNIRADLEKKGTPIGPLDILIAAHVKSMGLTLVTNNEKEFLSIEGLKVEN